MGLLADPWARRSVVPSTRMGNTHFPIRGRGVPLLLTQRRTTMSSNPSLHVACRLLGGSGRPQLVAAPPRKLPALCATVQPYPDRRGRAPASAAPAPPKNSSSSSMAMLKPGNPTWRRTCARGRPCASTRWPRDATSASVPTNARRKATPPHRGCAWMVLTAKLKNPISPENFSIAEPNMQRSHRHRCSKVWRRLRTWRTEVATTQEGKVA